MHVERSRRQTLAPDRRSDPASKLTPMPTLKQDAVQEIKDRLDLVDLVSEHLRLQKAGRDLKGLCPFHQEKTPSLYVSPEKQLWHCYGCQKGGDHFTFIQDIEHVDFRGALRLLAEKTGVVLEESPGAGRQRELKRTIAKLNLLAAQYFHHILMENPAGQRALVQLESRGVTRASMTEFQLGFAPAGQRKDNLIRFLRKHGATDSEMLEAGLGIRPEGGGELWDRVRLRKREAQELVLAFDRDDAGLNATQRAIELASKSGTYIKVVRVPQGKDPDDYLRTHPDGWASLREHALPEWEYLLRQVLTGLDLTEAEDRRRGADLVIPVLAKIPEASVLEIYAQQAAGWLRIESVALLRDVQAVKSGHPLPGPPHKGEGVFVRRREGGREMSPPRGNGEVGRRLQVDSASKRDEGYLLGLLIARPDLVPDVAGQLEAGSFSAPADQRSFTRLQRMVEDEATVRPTDRLSEFAPDEQGLISAVAMAKYPELDSGSEAALRQSLEQCLQTLKINAAQRRLKALVAEMRAARASGDESRLVTLMQENDRLAHQLDALKDMRHGQG